MALSNNATYISQNNLKGFAKIKFWLKVRYYYILTYLKLWQTLLFKKCYYGPFKGEFGHMLGHTAPFLMYLHKKGVKIIYCGMELHAPILVNENRESIISDFRPLRDFFSEVSPRTNSTVPPEDVRREIDKFVEEAKRSWLPFWNIDNDFYYYFVHRNFVADGHNSVYNLKKAYQTELDQKAVSIFPRSKGARVTVNNGGPWDYQQIVDTIKPFVSKIYIVGHPSQVFDFPPQEKVEVCVTADNKVILEKCANSQVIVTQHSGVNYLGDYMDIDVLLIYNGKGEIGSIENTIRFKKSLNSSLRLTIARDISEIEGYIEEKFALGEQPKRMQKGTVRER